MRCRHRKFCAAFLAMGIMSILSHQRPNLAANLGIPKPTDVRVCILQYISLWYPALILH